MNSGIGTHEERKKLLAELSQLLNGLSDDYVVSNPTASPTYNEDVYTKLEHIDPSLRKIDESIVQKLFVFGFPLPIYDLEDFVSRMSENFGSALERLI